jgi:hypothetical protein
MKRTPTAAERHRKVRADRFWSWPRGQPVIRRAAAAGFMVLSRLACILIHVYALQVTVAQPSAAARSKLAAAGARIEIVRGVGCRIVAS